MELANPETSGSRETTQRFDVDKKWMDLKIDLLLQLDDRVAETNTLEVLDQTEARIRAVASAFGKTMFGSANRLADNLASLLAIDYSFPGSRPLRVSWW